MTNGEIARVISEIGALLEIKGENPFKIRAYQRVAEAIGGLGQELSDLRAADELRSIPGVGASIAEKIEELLDTGQCAHHQELLREICRISAEAGVELQPVVYSGAASDASLVYSIGASPRVACLGYVRASSHGFEATPLRTFDAVQTVVEALLENL